MDERLWQTLGSFDFLYSSHTSSNNVMWDTQHNNAGWACFRILSWKSWRLKIDLSGIWCKFGNHTFVVVSWMCKKQTSVSHSSTESEFFSRINPAKDCGADRVFSSFVVCGGARTWSNNVDQITEVRPRYMFKVQTFAADQGSVRRSCRDADDGPRGDKNAQDLYPGKCLRQLKMSFRSEFQRGCVNRLGWSTCPRSQARRVSRQSKNCPSGANFLRGCANRSVGVMEVLKISSRERVEASHKSKSQECISERMCEQDRGFWSDQIGVVQVPNLSRAG